MIEGIQRTLWGSIIHAFSIFYFFFYPFVLFVMLLVNQDLVPESLASYSWITYLNFALMIFYAAVLGFGMMHPLKRLIRMITAGLFLGSILTNLASIIFVMAQFGQPMDVVPTAVNTVLSAALAVGLIAGYESRLAPFLLPFRREGVEDEFGSGQSDA